MFSVENELFGFDLPNLPKVYLSEVDPVELDPYTFFLEKCTELSCIVRIGSTSDLRTYDLTKTTENNFVSN
jgi:hypothetical protein